MADTEIEENNDFNLGIKDLFIFLGSGAFAAFHKEFLAPSSETSWSDLVVNLFHQIRRSKPSLVDVLTGWIDPVHQVLHAYIHFFISIALQTILLLWMVKYIIVAYKEIKARWK